MKSISDVFSKNRAEEFPDDLWGNYVLPRNYSQYDLRKLKKAAIIVGGRGSGKTMFLKYHCHSTVFSTKREHIPSNSLENIGLYFRPDTSFTRMINKEWIGDNWESIFNTFLSISILIEFSKLITSIIESKIEDINLKDSLKNFKIPTVIATSLKLSNVQPMVEIEDSLRDCLFEICNWINLPAISPPPFNLDLKITLLLLIERFSKISKLINNSSYHIFIDEFENLTFEQQKVINTWLKHGQNPLIFSVAYKKHAEVSRETKSQERIVERDDFRTIDLEQLYFDESNPSNYELLAAEVATLKLVEYFNLDTIKDVIKLYSDEGTLIARKNKEYQDKVRNFVCPLFPSESNSNIAREIINTQSLKEKLISSLINEGLKLHKNKKFTPYDFINIDYPEASIVNGVLLNRKGVNNTPEIIHSEFKKLLTGQQSKYKSWIPNNLVGVILFIYNSFPNRPCPIYAGFNQYVMLSKGNLRHFLELCYQALLRAEVVEHIRPGEVFSAIPVEIQAKSTLRMSTLELEKISDLGANGIHLKRIAKRLGIIFKYSQKRKSQSEPEVNHFSIALSDISLLDKSTQKLLKEALIWSVLFEQKSTKNKSDSEVEMVDYILHPVLSASFGISYRKKRKLRLSCEQVEVIFNGDEERFNNILKNFGEKWGIQEEHGNIDNNININGQIELL